ncbi:MAG TPA: bifunctional oligoribonuclease/PAP phosphatase NrnA [Prolixibacteraceae bacterium]|nr:bifunctional oligoribonuclease/PAP phosphatase NrnA [Prolixibacteraceae bacterium]
MSTLIDPTLLEKVKTIMLSSDYFVIIPHVNPDGDAIGSCIALSRVLKNMGKNVNIITPNEFPEFLQWMEGIDDVIDFEKNPEKVDGIFDRAETLFCLDFNDFERTEGLKNYLSEFKGTTVVIDHHPGPMAKCDLLLSYPSVCSTGELLFRIVEGIGLLDYLDRPAADAVFTGIMTDTGNFSYNASDPETYHIIAKLLEKGIDRDLIHSNVFHTFSEDRWRLIGHALKEKMVILPQYRTGYISLSKKELEMFNYQPGDTEGLVNYPLSVRGVVFCVLFSEQDDLVKLSFRSKGNFSTNDFARKHFNGGGHINASGGKSFQSLEESVSKFEALLEEYRDELLNCF